MPSMIKKAGCVIRTHAYATGVYGTGGNRRSSSNEAGGLQRRGLDSYVSKRLKRRSMSVGGLAVVGMAAVMIVVGFAGRNFMGRNNEIDVRKIGRIDDARWEEDYKAEEGEEVGGVVKLNYVTPRDVSEGHGSLKSGNGEGYKEPVECEEWRRVAKNESLVYPYRKHFTSLDVIDWFLYVGLFDEKFHRKRVEEHRRLRYLDIAANHAKRWSSTWFFDRCMGWDGVCVEANSKYYKELEGERHCHIVKKCLSDREKVVRFSLTDAYGGVATEKGGERFGVDAERHGKDKKYEKIFNGVKEMKCGSVKTEVIDKLGMNHFDFMSLDVEQHELRVLQGVDWNEIVIDVIVTENRGNEVRRLLEGVGYVLYKGILKDYLYVRKESGLVPKKEFVEMMGRMDKRTYRFGKKKKLGLPLPI